MLECGGRSYLALRPDLVALSTPRVGLVVLATDHGIEHEIGKILPRREIVMNVTRVRSKQSYDWSSLSGIAGHLEDALELLLPGTPLACIAYGCTSGTIAAGEKVIVRRLESARPGAAATTPITAIRTALGCLGCRRIGVLTPYVRDVHDCVVRDMQARGFEVPVSASFGVGEDRGISMISPVGVCKGVLKLAEFKGIDGIFVSCTALGVVDEIQSLERETGVPVVTSNQALAWHLLRLAGVRCSIDGFGKLLHLQEI